MTKKIIVEIEYHETPVIAETSQQVCQRIEHMLIYAKKVELIWTLVDGEYVSERKLKKNDKDNS